MDMDTSTDHERGENDAEVPAMIHEDDVAEVVELKPIPDDNVENDSDEEMDESIPTPDNSFGRFMKHTDPVFHIATHPVMPNICASGGGDDLGYIWDSTSGEELMTLSGHTDSVSFVSFSSNGSYLASASVEGKIKIWKTTDSDRFRRWSFLIDLEGSGEVTWISWHSKGSVLLAGFADGLSSMWSIPSGETMQVFSGLRSMATCGGFTTDGKTVVVGSEESRLIVSDPVSGEAIHRISLREGKYRFRTQDGSYGISSLVVNPSSTLCILGGLSNGGVRIVNLRTGLVVAGIDNDHDPTATIEVGWYQPQNLASGVPLIISTGTDGKICVYDAVSYKLRASMQHADAITTMIIHTRTSRLTTGSVDQTLISWDLRTGAEVQKHLGHHDMVHHAMLTYDEKYLISGSEDGTACVFEIVE